MFNLRDFDIYFFTFILGNEYSRIFMLSILNYCVINKSQRLMCKFYLRFAWEENSEIDRIGTYYLPNIHQLSIILGESLNFKFQIMVINLNWKVYWKAREREQRPCHAIFWIISCKAGKIFYCFIGYKTSIRIKCTGIFGNPKTENKNNTLPNVV